MNKLHSRCVSMVKSGCVLMLVLMLAASHAWAKPVHKPKPNPKKTMVKVMTRNLYLGADIFKVVEAAEDPDPYAIPMAVAEVFNTMLDSNFWERAEAIADEIAEAEPHVVGLQEVSTFYVRAPLGEPDLVIDFYEVLNAALLARGLNYTAYTVENADVELPMLEFDPGPILSYVRMVDSDVLLVRQKLPSHEVTNGTYWWKLSLGLGGTTVDFDRGYVMADVKIKGDWYRFVNTHLEVRSAPGSVFRVVQSAQMEELLKTIDALADTEDPLPVVMVGDLNSSPEDKPSSGVVPGVGEMNYVPPYQLAGMYNYLDTWTEQARYGDGYTSGFDEYVSDPTAELTTRIDHVFVGMVAPEKIDKVISRVVGNEVSDMTPSGLWPSDHAGVVAKIKFLNR